jgi:hypothetical protein
MDGGVRVARYPGVAAARRGEPSEEHYRQYRGDHDDVPAADAPELGTRLHDDPGAHEPPLGGAPALLCFMARLRIFVCD